ncbi:MAG TPA: class I SAM-dependent methyltransferase, partial [Candidatus Berkiella sp.]|nr:class I SAM-dependent methyltransferase [Candidatus Berkiella sp.]
SGPVEGKLLQFLIKLSGAKTCLEVGTFRGYTALQIASALPVDGRLITCESRAHHAQIAQKYFDLSPHGHKIQLRLGDATRTLPSLEKQFDFIFI